MRVVDLSADVAYVEPGAAAGIEAGQFATFGQKRFWITSTNAKYARLALEGQPLALGAQGSVRVLPGELRERGLLRADADPSVNTGQWPRPTLPAQHATVRPVPLGPLRRDGRTELALIERTTAVVPLDGEGTSQGHTELRARLATQPFATLPLALRADASWLWYWNQNDLLGPRSPWQVRELELRYGDPLSGIVRAGRLRSAAPTIGAVDGVRAQTGYLGPLAIGGFGGFAPTTLDEQLDLDSTHFGADVQLADPGSQLAPYAALVAHATTFGGDLDQRRLALFTRLAPGPLRMAGGLELALWEEPNPFAAERLEISFAHADAQLRLGRFDAGARFSTFLPEQSRALAAEVALVQLCNTAPDNETCLGAYARRFTTGVDMGLELGDARIEGAATVYTEAGAAFFEGVTGQLGVRFFDPIAPSGALRESGLEVAAIGASDPLVARAGLQTRG